MRAAVLAAVLAACQRPDPGARSLADVHGDRALAVLRASSRVELGLSDGARRRPKTTWVTLDPWSALTLRRLVLDPESYDWKEPTMCGPAPRVVARFHGGGEEALVKLCFQCDVAVGEVGWGDIGPSRDRLAGIVRRALPGAKVPGL